MDFNQISLLTDSLENEEVINHFLANSSYLKDRIKRYTTEVLKQHIGISDGLNSFDIDVKVSNNELIEIMKIISLQWSNLGSVNPYHSVISDGEWESSKINDERLKNFYESGNEIIQSLKFLYKRNGVKFDIKDCLEVGCGVGRVTEHLARISENVVCMDVSESNLEICKNHLIKTKITNATPLLVENLEIIRQSERFDLVISIIVLQHNPPPIQYLMLKNMLAALKPGGICFFQTITGGKNYGYSVDKHLKNYATNDFELHALPMIYIFEIIEHENCSILEVLRDLYGGFSVDSYSFFVQKKSVND